MDNKTNQSPQNEQQNLKFLTNLTFGGIFVVKVGKALKSWSLANPVIPKRQG